MRRPKSKLIVLVISLLLSTGSMFTQTANAHGGGLDSQGGHNCRVGACAGTYHCHQAWGPACGGGTPAKTNATSGVFKNCTELRKVYPGGVALPGAVNAGGVTKKEPKYDAALYKANKKSDRDGDGIACEK